MQAIPRLLGTTITIRQLTSVFLSHVVAGGLLAATPLILQSIWSPHDFHAYASAVTPFAFAYPLISGGQQKSALRLLPRTRLSRRQATGTYLMCLAAISAAIAIWVGLASESHASTLLLLTGTFILFSGLRQSTVTILRALGSPTIEVCDQTATVTLIAAGIIAAATVAFSPAELLVFWSSSSVVIAIAELSILLRLGRPAFHRKLVPMIARDITLQGTSDAFTGVLMTLLYLIVGHVAGSTQLARLYIVMSFASLLTAGYTYALRLVQPAISLQIRRTSSVLTGIGRFSASRLVIICAIYTVAVLIADHELISLTNLGATVSLLFALLALMPVLAVVGVINFLFENMNATALVGTVRGAAAGAIVALSLAIPLVAWLGALGALGTIIMGEITHLAFLLNLEKRQRSKSRTMNVMVTLTDEAKTRRAKLA